MYEKQNSLWMNHSASAIGNNLSVNLIENRSVIHYAVVAGHKINLISAAVDGHSVNQQEIICKNPGGIYPSIVFQAKLVPTATRLLLVLCAEKGVQVFDAEGGLFLFYHHLSSGSGEGLDNYSKGACCIGFDKLCCGTSSGEILVFLVPRQRSPFKLLQAIPVTSEPIWDLTSHQDHVVCGTDSGSILVFKSSEELLLERLYKISGTGYPCTSLVCREGRIVGAYGSGHIRLFDLTTGVQTCEVTAHARWINCLDISDDLLMSAGDDTYVRLWKFNAINSTKIEHVENIHVANVLIQGAKFIGSTSSLLAVTGYDHNEMFFFKRL